MKTESYILRYGTQTEIEELAISLLSAAGLSTQPEALLFAEKAQFAQAMVPSDTGVHMAAKIVNGHLYVIGSSEHMAFTV
jgi:hypothetical protein